LGGFGADSGNAWNVVGRISGQRFIIYKLFYLDVVFILKSFLVKFLDVGKAFFDVHAYCAIEPDQRFGMKRYNFELFSGFPKELFSLVERQTLEQATEEYIRRTTDLINTKHKRSIAYNGWVYEKVCLDELSN
jgi:hypothetical protein